MGWQEREICWAYIEKYRIKILEWQWHVGYRSCCPLWRSAWIAPLMARFMGPTWGPSGADRTQVGPMLAPWILLSGTVPFALLWWVSENTTTCWKLIMISHDHGYMVSYDEVLKFRKSTTAYVNANVAALHQMLGQIRRVGIIFSWFDNFQLLVSVSNGRHGNGFPDTSCWNCTDWYSLVWFKHFGYSSFDLKGKEFQKQQGHFTCLWH